MEPGISGGDVGGSEGFVVFKEQKQREGESLGIATEEVAMLIQRYGSNVDIVFELYEMYKREAEEEKIQPVIFAILQYSLQYELAYKPADFFIRRTGALFFNYDWVKESHNNIINYMAKTLEWTERQKVTYEEELMTLLYEAIHFQ